MKEKFMSKTELTSASLRTELYSAQSANSPALENMGHRFSPDGFSVAIRQEVKYNRNPGHLPSPFRRPGSTVN
jgi:hypothetical protein